MTEIRPFEYKELKPKRSKYGNRKVEHSGQKYDSIIERDRHIFLLGEQAAGRIFELERQVTYRLEVNGVVVGTINPDFRYRVAGVGTVVEDVKALRRRKSKITGRVTERPFITPVFAFKMRLFEALFLQKLHIVTNSNLTSLPCP